MHKRVERAHEAHMAGAQPGLTTGLWPRSSSSSWPAFRFLACSTSRSFCHFAKSIWMLARSLPCICLSHSLGPSVGSSLVSQYLRNAVGRLINDRGLLRFLAVSGANVSS